MMTIHVVQEGETIKSIADSYGVSADRIVLENELIITESLVIGQTIVITFPEQTYVIQQGDTLLSIADSFGIPLLQILRNNPYLSDRQYIYPGETIVISYGEKNGEITTNGYANVFITDDNLKKTIPFLTYISIFGHKIIEDGEILEVDDTNLLQTAKSYGVAPLMILSTLSIGGQESIETIYNILNNEDTMDKLVDNILRIVKLKGYYGINITYELLTNVTLSAYEELHTRVYTRLKEEGFFLFVTLSLNKIFIRDRITFERIDYTRILGETDGIILLNYSWGTFFGPPAPLGSIENINVFLDYLSTQISLNKLVIGMPLIAYDWGLPYRMGLTKANSLTLQEAINLARQVGAIIEFDEVSQTPFFTYYENVIGIAREHVVWFIDARSIDAILKIILDRGLSGSGIWNIMKYYSQIWLIIHTQYEIVRIP